MRSIFYILLTYLLTVQRYLRDDTFSHVDRTLFCDGQTEQTQNHSIYRASIASRGKKTLPFARV